MTGPYQFRYRIKPQVQDGKLLQSIDNSIDWVKINRALSAVRNKMALPQNANFESVRNRPWSSIFKLIHDKKKLLIKIEHLPSELYFEFLQFLPRLDTHIVVEPVCFIAEESVSVFEVEREKTLRQEIRDGNEKLDQLEEFMFGYGKLQRDFVAAGPEMLLGCDQFHATKRSFEDAVLNGVSSAETILDDRRRNLSKEVSCLLSSAQIKELPRTLLHTDLHDGNAFFGKSRWQIGDWSELLVGPMGSDIMLFFHAISIAHPSNSALGVARLVFPRFMSGIGNLLSTAELHLVVDLGYRLLPAIQLNGLQRAIATLHSPTNEVAPEQKFWSEALLRAFDHEQTSQNQFLQELHALIDRNIGIN